MSCSQPRSPLFPYTTLFRSFLKQDLFNAEAQALTERLKRNLAILNKKIDEPSRKVELESIDPLVAQLQSLLVEANEATNEHNQMVANIAVEKRTLIGQVWRYVRSEERRVGKAWRCRWWMEE